MVWATALVLVALVFGWYFWTQGNTTPAPQTSPVASDTPTLTPGPAPAPTPTPSDAPMTATVVYDGKKYVPASVTIAKGGTVTFMANTEKMWVAADPHPSHTNYDETARQQHCAAGATKSFDQCVPSASYSFTFDKAGTWDYHDHLNSAAEGVVIVK